MLLTLRSVCKNKKMSPFIWLLFIWSLSFAVVSPYALASMNNNEELHAGMENFQFPPDPRHNLSAIYPSPASFDPPSTAPDAPDPMGSGMHQDQAARPAVGSSVSGKLKDLVFPSHWSEESRLRLGLLLGMMCKAGLDAVALQQTIEQMRSIEDLRDVVASPPAGLCQGLCQSNYNDFSHGLKSARYTDAATVAVLGATLVSNVLGIGQALCSPGSSLKKYWGVAPIISIFGSGVSFITGLAANGSLWNLSLNHTDAIPQPVIDALNTAMKEGVAPLVLSGIVGLPAACIGAYLSLET